MSVGHQDSRNDDELDLRYFGFVCAAGISKEIDRLKSQYNIPMVREFSIADCDHVLEQS
jgi:hypothetical protein